MNPSDHQNALTYQVFTLMDLLQSHGVQEIVISPGSRSTPLALAAELHPDIHTHIHPDERSAAFFALGLAKLEHSPVGLICTSGTAAANYLPAIAEADLSHIPLLALTADRPHELRDVGAPQAINQRDMYRNYVRYYTELPIADVHESLPNLLETKVMQCAQYLRGLEMGPVHINIPIREPLMPDMTRTDLFFRTPKALTQYRTVPEAGIRLDGHGIVLIGETVEELDAVAPILDRDNLTVITDPRQHIRRNLAGAITHQDLIFNSMHPEQFERLEREVDFIVRIGEPLTSKATNKFLAQSGVPQYLISEHQILKTFPVAPKEAFVGTISEILKSIEFSSGGTGPKAWLTALDARISKRIEKYIADYDDEGRFMYEIIRHTPAHRAVFLSNSMPIRDGERYDLDNTQRIYANRGANGIDGVVSTALGMAVKTPLTLVIGDIALYHDMNGLIMSKLEDIDINIIVFNNNGGGIFSFLPQNDNQEHFERLFGTPLDLDFRHTAELYNFNYMHTDKIADITNGLMNQKGRNIIEIKTDRVTNAASHQDLRRQIEDVVKSVEI
ncbi:2-succinyl-5-enolpyruvyl-6-hydroxy-3-cyclohexene-1-carboxylic-acid synthase [Salinicoccus luteus]|uniref:2-succinyl-5-enolpyruvyl-6-hydroxy-3- cyclohexene-1-carboxylic-acid synthase n=1 Tax=Salinicoccus luteus TaxID=367840 RepID=UPI0004E2687C|nr:2-succinyl-5-enolpyruvyl-6-hydroxy-3-cyclohexene-1-carboxylic-acid synthase [Salinicoccus luteus]